MKAKTKVTVGDYLFLLELKKQISNNPKNILFKGIESIIHECTKKDIPLTRRNIVRKMNNEQRNIYNLNLKK